MSLTQSEERMLQQLRDDVDRLIANGRGDSRTGQTRGNGATVIKGYKAANGFSVGTGVYLDYDDNTWKKIDGTSFAYEDYLWGIVSFVLDVNRFSVTVNGEMRVPGASFTVGAPYGFNATGVLDASATRLVVKATLDDAILVGAGVGNAGVGSITVDIEHTAHGFSVGTFLYRDDTTGLHAKTDNTDPLKCDVRGFVSTVTDANNFTLTLEGWKTVVAGNTGTLYLSTNGALTATTPTTGAVIPVLYPVEREGTFDAYFQAVNAPRVRFVKQATTSPLVTSDSAAGYALGDVWINTLLDKVFIAADVAVGAAKWVEALPTIPTGSGWVLVHDGSSASWDRTVVLGESSSPGSLTVANATTSTAIVLSPSLITTSGKAMSVREIDVCDAGTAKKMLILASAPY
jgi:hypothetical protein